jgi:hypothetical protein
MKTRNEMIESALKYLALIRNPALSDEYIQYDYWLTYSSDERLSNEDFRYLLNLYRNRILAKLVK